MSLKTTRNCTEIEILTLSIVFTIYFFHRWSRRLLKIKQTVGSTSKHEDKTSNKIKD